MNFTKSGSAVRSYQQADIAPYIQCVVTACIAEAPVYVKFTSLCTYSNIHNNCLMMCSYHLNSMSVFSC